MSDSIQPNLSLLKSSDDLVQLIGKEDINVTKLKLETFQNSLKIYMESCEKRKLGADFGQTYWLSILNCSKQLSSLIVCIQLLSKRSQPEWKINSYNEHLSKLSEPLQNLIQSLTESADHVPSSDIWNILANSIKIITDSLSALIRQPSKPLTETELMAKVVSYLRTNDFKNKDLNAKLGTVCEYLYDKKKSNANELREVFINENPILILRNLVLMRKNKEFALENRNSHISVIYLQLLKAIQNSSSENEAVCKYCLDAGLIGILMEEFGSIDFQEHIEIETQKEESPTARAAGIYLSIVNEYFIMLRSQKSFK